MRTGARAKGRQTLVLLATMLALAACRGTEQWHEAYFAAQEHRGQAIYVREMETEDPLKSGDILLHIAMSQIIKDDWQTVFDNAIVGVHKTGRFSHFRPYEKTTRTKTTECFYIKGVGRRCGRGSGAIYRMFETWGGSGAPPDGFVSMNEARRKLAELRNRLGAFEVFRCSGSIVGCTRVDF